MIYTVTLNPALDKTVEIPSFTTDGVNRITSIRTDPGGKGINVSKVVAALGSTSRALGILGGSTGQMISEALSGLNMTCDFLPVEGNTRINLKVVDPIAHTSTEINEPGVPVDPATLQSLLDHLAAGRTADEIRKRVRNRQAVMQRIDHDRNDAQRPAHCDCGRKGRLILEPAEPDQKRHEHHAAARTEKSVDKSCQRTCQQAEADARLCIFPHLKTPFPWHSLP